MVAWNKVTKYGNGHVLRAFEVAAVQGHNIGLVANANAPGWELAEAAKELFVAVNMELEVMDSLSIMSEDEHFLWVLPKCRCGYLGSRRGNCYCSVEEINYYLRGVVDFFLRKTAIRIAASEVMFGDLLNMPGEDISKAVERVVKARTVKMERTRLSKMPKDQLALLSTAYDQFIWQPRDVTSVLSVARSISMLEGKTEIGIPQLAEAIQYHTRNILV
jgi:hypothetical protein